MLGKSALNRPPNGVHLFSIDEVTVTPTNGHDSYCAVNVFVGRCSLLCLIGFKERNVATEYSPASVGRHRSYGVPVVLTANVLRHGNPSRQVVQHGRPLDSFTASPPPIVQYRLRRSLPRVEALNAPASKSQRHVTNTEEGHFLASRLQLQCHLEGHKGAKGVSVESVGTIQLMST